jgi:hypothetical protein
MPGEVHVDSGSQLEKHKDTSFNVRDIHSQEARGLKFKVIVTMPKAHHEHGHVERKIRTLRYMLDRLSSSSEVCNNTMIGWETFLQESPAKWTTSPSPEGQLLPSRTLAGRSSRLTDSRSDESLTRTLMGQ